MNVGISALMLWGITVAGCTAWLGLAWRWLARLLHILQLEGYHRRRFIRWLARRLSRYDQLRTAPWGLLPLLAWGLASGGSPPWVVAAAIVGWGGGGLYRLRRLPPVRAKRPLTWTPKAILLALLVCGQLVAAPVVLAVVGDRVGGPTAAAAGAAVGLAGGIVLLPMLILVATFLLTPGQTVAERVILALARRKLRRSAVRVIGITGSYGKTSTKEFTATLLASHYRVLKTPESYNTPLGIARVIWRALQPDHDYLIIELGAYGPGEISRLCELVQPQIGVLTAVGPQHLERFGTLERIAAAKYELIEALPDDGVAVCNADDPVVRELAAQTPGCVVRYSLRDPPGPDIDLAAAQVRSSGRGITFTIRDRSGTEQPIAVSVLGVPNVSNVLAAVAVARTCGLSLDEIAAAARAIEPVPHRLQPIDGAGGLLVLDDAYNANPVGAAAALDVLRSLPGRRKLLVTPGMVELGDRHDEEHRALGQRAAAACDTVILVGPQRTAPIRAGLAAAGFPADQVIVVTSLAEATARLPGLAGPGDVVLFENDLPDTYDETEEIW